MNSVNYVKTQKKKTKTIRKRQGKRVQLRLKANGAYYNSAFTNSAVGGGKCNDVVDADSASLTTVSSLNTTTQSTSVDVYYPYGGGEAFDEVHEPLDMVKVIFGYY